MEGEGLLRKAPKEQRFTSRSCHLGRCFTFFSRFAPKTSPACHGGRRAPAASRPDIIPVRIYRVWVDGHDGGRCRMRTLNLEALG